MRLLCKVGRYSGQVIDYSDKVGQRLLKDGRAARVPKEKEEKKKDK